MFTEIGLNLYMNVYTDLLERPPIPGFVIVYFFSKIQNQHVFYSNFKLWMYGVQNDVEFSKVYSQNDLYIFLPVKIHFVLQRM